MLRFLSRRSRKRAQFPRRRRRNRGYALPSVIVLALVLVVSSTAMMVRAAGERAAGGQDRQIILARNNAENGITEIVRQLNGPFSYLSGINKFDDSGNNRWKTIAEQETKRRREYYESVLLQLQQVRTEIAKSNGAIRVGCETDANGKLIPYSKEEVDSLIEGLEALVADLTEWDQQGLPSWISQPSKRSDTLTASNSPWISSGAANAPRNNRLRDYQIVTSGGQPTQATIQSEGFVGLGGNGQAVITQRFNLQPSEVGDAAIFPYSGLLFKAADSNIGGLDVETAGQIVRDPISNQDVTVYNFCLANVTCIDCKSLDPKASDGLKRKEGRNDIAGILSALGNEYDFPRATIDKILRDNPAKPAPGLGDVLNLSNLNLGNTVADLLNGITSLDLNAVTLNRATVRTSTTVGSDGPQLEFFNIRPPVSADITTNGQITADVANSLLGLGLRAEVGVNGTAPILRPVDSTVCRLLNPVSGLLGGLLGSNSCGRSLDNLLKADVINVNGIEVTGRNRAVIRIDANSIMTDRGRIRPDELIRRPDKNTPLPIVIIEGPITLETSGNKSLGDAFIIAPDAKVIAKGGGNESSRLLTGSMWVSSFENNSNAGGNSSKTFLDGKAEIVVDPDMPKILKQLGLTELAINQGAGGGYQGYRLVPGSASNWTINTAR